MTKKMTHSSRCMASVLKQRMKLLVVVAALVSGGLQAQVVTTITTPGAGTFTLPAGVTSMTVECWGGGGAGGSAQCLLGGVSTKQNVKAGGGAGGSYAQTIFSNPEANTYSYSVGAGGNVGTTSAVPPSGFANDAVYNGASSTFTGPTSTVTAVGGLGGQSKIVTDATPTFGAGGTKQSSGNTGTINWYGGAGATGNATTNAAGGGSAGSGGDGGDANGNTPGAAGAGGGVIGAAVGTSTHNIGNVGAAPGAGGSGANSTPLNAGTSDLFRKGGNGGNGQIRITYIVDSPNNLSTTKANTYVTVIGRSLVLNGEVNAVEVFNAQGKLIQSQNKVTRVNVNNNGIYIVKMYTPQGVNVQKVRIK